MGQSFLKRIKQRYIQFLSFTNVSHKEFFFFCSFKAYARSRSILQKSQMAPGGKSTLKFWWLEWKSWENQVPLQLALYNEPNCNLIQEPVILIQGHFNRSRFIKAVKLQRSFDRFQYSLCVNKKNSLGKYSLFFESSTLNYSQLHWIYLYRNDLYSVLPKFQLSR